MAGSCGSVPVCIGPKLLGLGNAGGIVLGVGTDEPTTSPGEGTTVLHGQDVPDPVLESAREMLERLRTAAERRHQKVTELRADITRLDEEIRRICVERETLLGKMAQLRAELTEGMARIDARSTGEDVQPPDERSSPHA
jgi:hypothetical protein